MQPNAGAELVSVIIPSYNRAYCIERAVDSALAQTYAPIEVIVVDDGSSDATAEVMARRYGADARVRYIRQENRGVAGARNTGLAAAKGEYVALLDSDDAWKRWKIALQVCCLRRLPEAGMVWTDMEAVHPDGSLVSPRYLRTMYKAYARYPLGELFAGSWPVAEVCPGIDPEAAAARLYEGDIFSPMMTGNLVHTSTILIRRERLAAVKGFNEDLRPSGEDYDFHLRTCLAGKVAFVDVSSIRYQVDGADQLTRPAYMIHIARNLVRTITPLIERERGRIHLPPGVLENVQARAHAWVGREALAAGSNAEARRHLFRSLRFRPGQPSVWGYLALAIAPRAAYLGARSAMRLARRVVRGAPPA